MPKLLCTRDYQALYGVLIAAHKGARLTQEHRAERLNKPQSLSSKFERGKRRLDVVKFLAIARALDADPNHIIIKVQQV